MSILGINIPETMSCAVERVSVALMAIHPLKRGENWSAAASFHLCRERAVSFCQNMQKMQYLLPCLMAQFDMMGRPNRPEGSKLAFLLG